MKNVFTLFFVLISFFGMAQSSLSVRVISQEDNENLIGAHISLMPGNHHAVSDKDGVAVFKDLKEAEYELQVSFVGFETYKQQIKLANSPQKVKVELESAAILTDEVIIKGVRAGEKTPTTYSNVSKELIQQENLGQDLPFLLESTPSLVTTSDAGTGIGYSNLRVRGTDITRINVTVNGIPLNDQESHSVFFVNMPDFASSVENIQVQRGVGTSSNGSAAFGASINMQTTTLNPEPYARISSSAGSFNTFKNSLNFGTGLIDGKFTVDGRLSKLTSDGFIDRAFSDLKSFFVSAGYYGEKDILKFTIFSGKEKTYQAWNGIPKDTLAHNRTYNSFTYDNQTDNYQQDHYQMHYSRELMEGLNINANAFYVYGRGYYEQYKEKQKMQNYGFDPLFVVLPSSNDTVKKTNLVRRKWLRNNFYGANLFVNYNKRNLDLTVGGGYTDYAGDHYGRIIWAQYASNSTPDQDYYFSEGNKKEKNAFAKAIYSLNDQWSLFGDLQYRHINYVMRGITDDRVNIDRDLNFDFFNPKAGLFFQMNKNNAFYASFAIANRVPSRADYIDAKNGQDPKQETLFDYELGYKFNRKNFNLEANLFYMKYRDQLVLTGELNDVGAALKTNVPNSYRFGLEMSMNHKPVSYFEWNAALALSENKILDFHNSIPEYSEYWEFLGYKTTTYKETTISFSPSVVANAALIFHPLNGMDLEFRSKYVSRQYIDNREDKEWSLDPYFVSDLRLAYHFKTPWIKEVEVSCLVNNVFGEEYETNAWVAPSYIGGVLNTDYNGFFPQAGRNFLIGLSLNL